jgi:peptidoglycan/xylan/chitin deacetylase (PgdA/CDA1 family)
MRLANWLSNGALGLAALLRNGGVIINEHTIDAMHIRLHIEVLRRWFDFIELDDLPNRLAHPKKRPFCLLTFDDGKESNATQVAPELLRLGVSAVFYVLTEAVGSGGPLWFDRYAALRRTLGRAPRGLGEEFVKRLPFAVLKERLDQACAEHGVEADMASEHIRPMNWQQVRALARNSFTIGAHGLSHAILTNETEVAARAEIDQSLSRVASETGSPCTTFAFPNGNYTPGLAQHALKSGARTVMTTDPVWVDRQCPLWRLPRIQLSSSFPPARISLKLAAAATGRILQNPDGTGRSYLITRRKP